MFKKIRLSEPEEEFFSISSDTEESVGGFSAGANSIMRSDPWFCEWITEDIDEYFEEEDRTRRSSRAPRAIRRGPNYPF